MVTIISIGDLQLKILPHKTGEIHKKNKAPAESTR